MNKKGVFLIRINVNRTQEKKQLKMTDRKTES